MLQRIIFIAILVPIILLTVIFTSVLLYFAQRYGLKLSASGPLNLLQTGLILALLIMPQLLLWAKVLAALINWKKKWKLRRKDGA